MWACKASGTQLQLTRCAWAVTLMHEQQVGSIVIVDAHKAPLGIFTLRDLRQVVADGTSDFNQVIESHMTQAPFYLSPVPPAIARRPAPLRQSPLPPTT